MLNEPTWMAYSQWMQDNLFIILVFIFFGLSIAERIYYGVRHPNQYPDLDALSSIATGFFARIIRVAIDLFLVFTIYIWVFENIKLFDLSHSLWGFPIGLLLHDFAWYWQHRIKHRSGFFWADHLVHHSSNTFTFPVAQRASFANRLLRSPAFAIAALAGVSPTQFAVVTIVANFWGIITHSNTIGRLGWLEGVLVTPSSHRVHHGTQPQYIDKNYGEFFCFWDRMFGTYQKEDVPVKFGLVTPLETLNPFTIQISGFQWLWKRLKSTTSWKDRLNYLWRPPEWQHSDPLNRHSKSVK